MDRREQGPAILFAAVVVLLALGLLAWLLLPAPGPPVDAMRRGPRFSAEHAAWLAEIDAAHARLSSARQADDSPAVYAAARELREGLRALLRAAPVDGGTVELGYAPGAEALVAELLAEDQARGASVRQVLGEDAAARLWKSTRPLEDTLSQAMRANHSDPDAFGARLDDFEADFTRWRPLAAPGSGLLQP